MTLTKKCPHPPNINFSELLPGDLTPREVCIKSREQKWQLNTQESTEGGNQSKLDAQESPDLQDAKEKHIPSPSKEKEQEKYQGSAFQGIQNQEA